MCPGAPVQFYPVGKNENKKITGDLGKLKQNYLDNKELILELEDTLNNILEAELEDKVKNYIKTDAINNEKITPRFLSLAKEFTNDSLTVICDENDTKFNSESGNSYSPNSFRYEN